MESLWNESEAKNYAQSDLLMRVYTSRLLGQSEDLVLHGGGNTSVKITEKNIFNEVEELLYVKGSGWDLKTIETEGFSPVQLDKLIKLGALTDLSDMDMVRELKTAMTNPNSPGPSIETILHGLIPFKFVDHTHADAVVTISNTPGGEEKLQEIYGENVLILPYIMPGFILSKQVYEACKDINWNQIEGIILLHHGVFTFDHDARKSYEKMITIVSKAEKFLESNGANDKIMKSAPSEMNPLEMARFRRKAMDIYGAPVLVRLKNDDKTVGFSKLSNLKEVTKRGPVTPDHIIHTKKTPAIIENDPVDSLVKFQEEYQNYFNRNENQGLNILDQMPRYAFWPKKGALILGPNIKRIRVVSDILDHTIKSIQMGEAIGGWKPLGEKDLFEVEYWELEQAKLKKTVSKPTYEGRVVLISGAASGIGKFSVQSYLDQGASVIALDINPEIKNIFNSPNYLGLVCDVCETSSIKKSLQLGIEYFGGIDILISNAGNFPDSVEIENTSDDLFDKTINLNLTGHLRMIRETIPYLKLGYESSVIIVGSKNVPAPGPGAAAYSTAKAGLTQLSRVAALELGKHNIRVNVIHPNAVFDTSLWTEDVLSKRADNYGISVEEYKKRNILNTTITAKDVADLISTLSSGVFSKTTGAQIPIDGGNDRVI